MFDAAAPPPPPAGLGAAGAVPASGDRFIDFWREWPRKHGKKKAEAEWRKLMPDADLASHIIVTARMWATHYRTHGTPMQYIAEPANWLRDERFDEDLPLVHRGAKDAAVASAKANAPLQRPTPNPANDDREYLDNYEPEEGGLTMVNDVGMLTPIGTFNAVIAESEVDVLPGIGEQITLTLHLGDDRVEHSFFWQAADYEKQERGQAFLRKLAGLAGLIDINDTDQLHGLEVTVTITPRREIIYEPARQERAA